MEWLVLLTFVLSFFSSILSGMAGGGGGFIMTPYFLFIGLPPANAIATMKLTGLGTGIGALTAFKGKGLVHKKLIIPFMIITFCCALTAAWFIPRIDPGIFQKVIAVILLAMVPTLFIKKARFQPGSRSNLSKGLGFVAYAIIALMVGLMGAGIGTLLVLVLMYLFGLGALEANATKRTAGIIQVTMLTILLAIQGLVVWTHGIAAVIGSTMGSHLGGHIAMKKGDRFIKIAMAVFMVISGIALLM